MIKYSTDAKLKQSIFFAYRNDIDIYTEDNDNHKEFYRSIFKRILPKHVKIKDVFPIGSKAEVQKAHDAYLEGIDKYRLSLFLVDGDLDVILNRNENISKHLFYLDSYCIENYVFEENAFIKAIYYCLGDTEYDEVKKKLDYQKLCHNFAEKFIDLFLHFAALKEVGGGPQLRTLYYYFRKTNNIWSVNSDLIDATIGKIKTEIITTKSTNEYEELIKVLKERWPIEVTTMERIISGKDYLIPLIQIKISELTGQNSFFTKTNLRLLLLEYSSLMRLGSLRDHILELKKWDENRN